MRAASKDAIRQCFGQTSARFPLCTRSKELAAKPLWMQQVYLRTVPGDLTHGVPPFHPVLMRWEYEQKLGRWIFFFLQERGVLSAISPDGGQSTLLLARYLCHLPASSNKWFLDTWSVETLTHRGDFTLLISAANWKPCTLGLQRQGNTCVHRFCKPFEDDRSVI